MRRWGNDLAALFPRFSTPAPPSPHSRLAGSRRPEIRFRFRADLPGQRKQQDEKEEKGGRGRGSGGVAWKNVRDSRSKAREKLGKIPRVNGNPLFPRVFDWGYKAETSFGEIETRP